ncbi:MAG: 2-oxo acid dehydrogenase subunit E2 [Anaerolineae bacterium]|nr:2-oxo acid dehydrogenase subunit E2 [Anaerolineae bacterium]
MVTEVILPVLGETMNEGTIVEWLKAEGSPVQRGEVLFTLESDKATLEAEAPATGFLRKILVPPGQTVPVLTVVGLITKTADEDISAYESRFQLPGSEFQVAEAVAPRPSEPETVEPETLEPLAGRLFVSPRARRLAREKGVDLAQVTGSGPNGRIVEEDVIAFLEAQPKVTPVAQRLAEQAGLDLRTVQGTGPGGRITKEDVELALSRAEGRALAEFQVPGFRLQVPEAVAPVPSRPETFEPETLKPLSGVRAVIARRMAESHQTTAPVTLTTEVDATAFVELRERLKESLAASLGFNIGYNDLLIKLAARALREFPYMNVRQEEGGIRQLQDVHVALAVDTDRGLLVPVIRHADRKGVSEIARELRELVARAREGKALPDELTGSTFTITNLGMHEIDAFTPIINLPEVAILGVGRIKARPAAVDGAIVVRQTMWLSLTFDHRLVDGAPAARFLQRIKQLVEEPYLLLS